MTGNGHGKAGRDPRDEELREMVEGTTDIDRELKAEGIVHIRYVLADLPVVAAARKRQG